MRDNAAGERLAAARKAFHQAATELAFYRFRVVRGVSARLTDRGGAFSYAQRDTETNRGAVIPLGHVDSSRISRGATHPRVPDPSLLKRRKNARVRCPAAKLIDRFYRKKFSPDSPGFQNCDVCFCAFE